MSRDSEVQTEMHSYEICNQETQFESKNNVIIVFYNKTIRRYWTLEPTERAISPSSYLNNIVKNKSKFEKIATKEDTVKNNIKFTTHYTQVLRKERNLENKLNQYSINDALNIGGRLKTMAPSSQVESSLINLKRRIAALEYEKNKNQEMIIKTQKSLEKMDSRYIDKRIKLHEEYIKIQQNSTTRQLL